MEWGRGGVVDGTTLCVVSWLVVGAFYRLPQQQQHTEKLTA